MGRAGGGAAEQTPRAVGQGGGQPGCNAQLPVLILIRVSFTSTALHCVLSKHCCEIRNIMCLPHIL